MNNQKWDVVYRQDEVSVEPHFCREYDCFGTNPDHGFSWRDACYQVAEHHKDQMDAWLRYSVSQKSHPIYREYDE